MQPAQLSLKEIIAVFRRRRKYFLLPCAIITLLSVVGAFVLPRRYESSTTILVQRDEILNPLVSYEMAVTIASEDRLRTFTEIINSRTLIQQLIDSLGLGTAATTDQQRQILIESVQKNITTERRGSDSFSITYSDSDPIRAQRAASLLADLFIQTVLHVEGQRNEQTVKFFSKKLQEIKEKFETTQQKVIAGLQASANSMPSEGRAASTQLDNIEKQIQDLDTKTESYAQSLRILQHIPSAMQSDSGKQSLYALQRYELPFSADFKALLGKYDEFLRRYTPKYPEVTKIEKQLVALMERMRNSIESESSGLQQRRSDLEKRRIQLVDELKRVSVNQHKDSDRETDYGIYKKLYDEMKVKLEQAQTARDLGSGAEKQFIIIDPAIVPGYPTKPNRTQVVLGGFGAALLFGFITVIFKELLDTTVRAPRDIEVYQKPIIAYITDGQDEYLN